MKTGARLTKRQNVVLYLWTQDASLPADFIIKPAWLLESANEADKQAAECKGTYDADGLKAEAAILRRLAAKGVSFPLSSLKLEMPESYRRISSVMAEAFVKSCMSGGKGESYED